jgi:hypothetical protein
MLGGTLEPVLPKEDDDSNFRDLTLEDLEARVYDVTIELLHAQRRKLPSSEFQPAFAVADSGLLPDRERAARLFWYRFVGAFASDCTRDRFVKAWLAWLRQQWTPYLLHEDIVREIVEHVVLPPLDDEKGGVPAKVTALHFREFGYRFQPFHLAYPLSRSLLMLSGTFSSYADSVAQGGGGGAGGAGAMAKSLSVPVWFTHLDRNKAAARLALFKQRREGSSLREDKRAEAYPRYVLRPGRLPTYSQADVFDGWAFTLTVQTAAAEPSSSRVFVQAPGLYLLEGDEEPFGSLLELLGSAMKRLEWVWEEVHVRGQLDMWAEADKRLALSLSQTTVPEEGELLKELASALPEVHSLTEGILRRFDKTSQDGGPDFHGRGFHAELDVPFNVADLLFNKRFFARDLRISMDALVTSLVQAFGASYRDHIRKLVERSLEVKPPTLTSEVSAASASFVAREADKTNVSSRAFWYLVGSPHSLKMRLRSLLQVSQALASLQTMVKRYESAPAAGGARDARLRLLPVFWRREAGAMARHLEEVQKRLVEIPHDNPEVKRYVMQVNLTLLQRLAAAATRASTELDVALRRDDFARVDELELELLHSFLVSMQTMGMDRLPGGQALVAAVPQDRKQLAVDPSYLLLWTRNFGLYTRDVDTAQFSRVLFHYLVLVLRVRDFAFDWVQFVVVELMSATGSNRLSHDEVRDFVYRFGPVARMLDQARDAAVPNLGAAGRAGAKYAHLKPKNANEGAIAWRAQWFTHLDRNSAAAHLDSLWNERITENLSCLVCPRFVVRPGRTPASVNADGWALSVSVSPVKGSVQSSRVFRREGGLLLLEGQSSQFPRLLECLDDGLQRLEWSEEIQVVRDSMAVWKEFNPIKPAQDEEEPALARYSQELEEMRRLWL